MSSFCPLCPVVVLLHRMHWGKSPWASLSPWTSLSRIRRRRLGQSYSVSRFVEFEGSWGSRRISCTHIGSTLSFRPFFTPTLERGLSLVFGPKKGECFIFELMSQSKAHQTLAKTWVNGGCSSARLLVSCVTIPSHHSFFTLGTATLGSMDLVGSRNRCCYQYDLRIPFHPPLAFGRDCIFSGYKWPIPSGVIRCLFFFLTIIPTNLLCQISVPVSAFKQLMPFSKFI